MSVERTEPLTALAPEAIEQLRLVAGRVFWWGHPDKWLGDIDRFLVQVMTYGDWDDVTQARDVLGDQAFRHALSMAPAGVMDIKSWTFWHRRYGLSLPPLPSRSV